MNYIINSVFVYAIFGIIIAFNACSQKTNPESMTNISFSNIVDEFKNPSDESKPWVYWWWLDGNASKEGISLDLKEMKRQGIGGVLLFDAGDGGPNLSKGPAFMSSEWRELFKHAVMEADRYGIILSANICSGWNAGGPWVTPMHAVKILVKSPPIITKSLRQINLPLLDIDSTEQDVVVLAIPLKGDTL